MKSKKHLNVVGIMSGTSLDGVDFVLTRILDQSVKFKALASFPFSASLKEKLFLASENKLDFRSVQDLHFRLGEFYFKKLNKLNWKFDLIGLHGQTVYHNAPHATAQIGEPSFLTRLGAPVVGNFRSKLIAFKSQAAPLAPVFHKHLMGRHKSWAFLNLGGMSNVTYQNKTQFLATDLGPANVFIDQAAQMLFKMPFDKGGVKALKGLPDPKFLKSFAQDIPFFKRAFPKSCGREEFSKELFLQLMKCMKGLNSYDKMATLSEFTLWPILKFFKNHPCKKLIVSGGGAFNFYFLNRLKFELQNTEVLTSEELGWPVQAIEGGAFALLAYKRIREQKLDLSYLGLSQRFGPLGCIN